jgi:hypothetical protein
VSKPTALKREGWEKVVPTAWTWRNGNWFIESGEVTRIIAELEAERIHREARGKKCDLVKLGKARCCSICGGPGPKKPGWYAP